MFNWLKSFWNTSSTDGKTNQDDGAESSILANCEGATEELIEIKEKKPEEIEQQQPENIVEGDFQSYIQDLKRDVDQYVENVKKGQASDDQENHLLEKCKSSFETCSLRYSQIKESFVGCYKVYKLYQRTRVDDDLDKFMEKAREVIKGYRILYEAFILLDVIKKLDDTLNDETIKKIAPLQNEITSLRSMMKAKMPELNGSLDESKITLKSRDISADENISLQDKMKTKLKEKPQPLQSTVTQDGISDDDDGPFFDAKKYPDGIDEKEYCALEEEAKKEFAQYIKNGTIDKVSIGKHENGNLCI